MVLIRYILVAGVAYGIDFGGFMLLIGFGYSPVLANILVKVVAAIFGFYAHRYFTYSISDREGISTHAVRYFGLALFYTPVSSVFLYFVMMLVPNPAYAKLMTDVLLFILMFWVTSKFAFTKTSKQKTS